jgi:hypothetical protein
MIIAVFTPRNLKVEILETWECGGVQLAAIRALSGLPFADGAKTTTKTAYLTVKAAELAPIDKNLLSMALQYSDRDQWYVGETVWLWGDNKRGAFLANEDGVVKLRLIGSLLGCTVFVLDHETWTWRLSNNLEDNYSKWIAAVEAEQTRMLAHKAGLEARKLATQPTVKNNQKAKGK